jgi:hypothetical protein
MRWLSISTTRLAGTLSMVALVLITISDFTFTEFWDTNAMATSIVADVLVLIVGVAVVNEFLAARSRSRWQLVAEYGLVELARSCRRVWIGLAERIGLGSRSELTREELHDLVLDRARRGDLRDLARAAVDKPEDRRDLRETVAELAIDARATLTAWAAILVEAARSDSIARFAEMQALLARLDLVLELEATGKRASAEEAADPDWVAQRIATILHIGANLAPELLASAERIQEREQRELTRMRAEEEGGSAAT